MLPFQLPQGQFVIRAILSPSQVRHPAKVLVTAALPPGQLFRQLVDLFQFYMLFPISNYDSEPISDEDMMAAHYSRVQQLQLLLYYRHPALKELALHNCGTVASRKDLLEHVSALQMEELRKLVVRELR